MGGYAKMAGIAVVWVVGICLFTGIVLMSGVKWFNRGGHPIIVAVIIGVICIVVTGIIAARKEIKADAEADAEANKNL